MRTLIALLLAPAATASAHPFTLYYWVEWDGIGYEYTFDLVQEGSFTGHLDWIVFADVGSIAPADAQGLSTPVLYGPAPAPFTSMTSSSGGHAGPTFLRYPSRGWEPTGIGDSMSWQVLAENEIEEGHLYWSNLVGDSPTASYELAVLSCAYASSLPDADLQDGVCEGATKQCVDDVVEEPDYAALLPDYEEVETRCDGLDNDCDGVVDEPDTLVPPEEDLADGVCAEATPECAGEDGWEAGDPTALPDYEASFEVSCDGLDNDCDGAVDEDLDAPWADLQDGVCFGSDKVCDGVNGFVEPDYREIEGYEVDERSCDEEDNDCDGEVDEPEACQEGDEECCPCEEPVYQTMTCGCAAGGGSAAAWLVLLAVPVIRRRR